MPYCVLILNKPGSAWCVAKRLQVLCGNLQIILGVKTKLSFLSSSSQN